MRSDALKAVIYGVICCLFLFLFYVSFKAGIILIISGLFYVSFVWVFVYHFYYRIYKGINKSFKESDAYKYWLSNFIDSVDSGNFLNSIPATIIIFELLGLLMVSLLTLKMDPNAWFYLYSTIPQVFSAFLALIAVFLFSHGKLIEMGLSSARENRMDHDESDNKIEELKYLMRISLKFSLFIIALSFISIPFGSVIINDNWVTYWADGKLKWFFVFFVVGFCVGLLYKIYSALKPLLSENSERKKQE